ncbi:MAG: HTTM domain-containing protein [Verrucomicrobia bacterium]|nr:HTTM domain-containing protein [Verrucomicrobiota bacterium]
MSPGYQQNAILRNTTICLVPIRVIQATLLLQYLASGLGKVFVGDWINYDDVLLTHVQGLYRTDFAAWCLRTLPIWTWTVMQWAALLFELEAPILFCVRKLRPVAFVVGMGFHLMIALMMKDLIFFSAQMWTFYALFITADEYRWAWDRLKRLSGPVERRSQFKCLGINRQTTNQKI